jgi:hypothetical protein
MNMKKFIIDLLSRVGHGLALLLMAIRGFASILHLGHVVALILSAYALGFELSKRFNPCPPDFSPQAYSETLKSYIEQCLDATGRIFPDVEIWNCSQNVKMSIGSVPDHFEVLVYPKKKIITADFISVKCIYSNYTKNFYDNTNCWIKKPPFN